MACDVHVLPCGTSILTNARERRVGGNPLAAAVSAMEAWADSELKPGQPVNAWRDSFLSNVSRRLDVVRRMQEPLRLSAEMASLCRHGALQPEDVVVLLASDTSKGLLAALLNAARLGRPVRVHAGPELDSQAVGEPLIEATTVSGETAAESVHVIRIPGLLPDSTVRFTEAMRDVARAMLWAGWLLPRDDMVLHLAGGYKATLPYLVVLAEYIKDVRPPVRVFCLHEGDPDSVSLPQPVEIFLRSVDSDADHTALATAKTESPPGDERLRDFAYTVKAGKAALTPVGKILWDMLDSIKRRRP